MTALDPITPIIVSIVFGIVLLSILLDYFKLPSVLTYIFAGILIGNYGLNLITDTKTISAFGSVGVILLLFFIGMEISLPKLINQWKTTVTGGLLQIMFSLAFVLTIGYFLGWELGRMILIGFVITLSSTALVLKLLEKDNLIKTRLGQNILSILIFQDIVVIPMFIILEFFSGDMPSTPEILLQLLGFFLIIIILIFVMKKGHFSLPFIKNFKTENDIHVFIALGICFGFAMITAVFGISSALGAFVGGILVSYTKEMKQWVYDSMHSLYVIFLALFFVSIGLLIDLNFFYENLGLIGFLVAVSFLVNIFVNSAILYFLKMPIKEAVYGGIILSQIGEFSFVLTSIGLSGGIINSFAYQLIITIISVTLILTPILILIFEKLDETIVKKRRKNFF